jgi:hypothetical protein
MAGSILGADQIRKVNESYPRIVAHIRDLFSKDQTPAGLMRMHFLTEYLDTTELATVFAGLPFLSPAEKRALVRAAIFDVLMGRQTLVAVDPAMPGKDTTVVAEVTPSLGDQAQAHYDKEMKTFTPARLVATVNTTAAFQGDRPADPPAPAPVEQSVHTPNVGSRLAKGAEQAKAEQLKRDSAAKEIRKDGK